MRRLALLGIGCFTAVQGRRRMAHIKADVLVMSADNATTHSGKTEDMKRLLFRAYNQIGYM
jgi:hypothetical protein